MALGYVDDKKVPNQRPPAKRAMRPKTGTGIQSPGGPVAPNATNRRPPGGRPGVGPPADIDPRVRAAMNRLPNRDMTPAEQGMVGSRYDVRLGESSDPRVRAAMSNLPDANMSPEQQVMFAATRAGMDPADQRKPGMRADLISRVGGVAGLSPNDRAALTSAIRSGGRGALRNAVMGKPYAQDVLQAINGSDGAAQNAPGQRPPVASTNRVPNDGRTEVANKQVAYDSATQAPPPGAVGGSALDANPASATLPAPAPVATQLPTSAGLPAPTPVATQFPASSPGADPSNAPAPAVDKAQQQSGYTSQQWGQLNKKLAGVDPALVAQWRAEMQNIPAGGGARYDFLASKIAEMNNQQPGPDGGPQPVPQGPSPYPYPGGGPSPGQTPPIYVPQQIPQTQGQDPAPQQFPDIFNPVFF